MDISVDNINALAGAIVAILAALTTFIGGVRLVLAELRKNTAKTEQAVTAAETAVEQTNGALDARIQTAIEQALTQYQTRARENDRNPDQGTLL